MNMKRTGMLIILAGLAAVVSSCGGGGGSVGTAPEMGAPTGDAPQFVGAPDADEAVRSLARGTVLDDDVANEDALADDEMLAMALADDDDAGRAAGRVAACKLDQVPPPGASGSPNLNDYYAPAKAFDGNYKTWWAGKIKARRWNLFYGFQASHYIEKVNVNFYGLDYVPKMLVVLTSADGVTWNVAAKVRRTKFSADIAINRETRFLWFRMWGNPKTGFPLVRDIAWTPFVEKPGAYAAPGADDNWYYASNAVDGDMVSQWAGQPGAGSWDWYYNFTAPRMIGTFTVNVFNVNYVMPMTLLISDDGVNWTTVGDLAAYPPQIFVGKAARYVWLQMRGAPVSGYPVIQEITFDFPAGASGGPSEKPDYWKPANAFDGSLNTWWVGKIGAAEWDLFYASGTPINLGTVTIQFYFASHAPAATELLTSDDGVNWTSAGTFTPGLASQTLAVNRTAKIMRFRMAGTPLVGYPLVKDITW